MRTFIRTAPGGSRTGFLCEFCSIRCAGTHCVDIIRSWLKWFGRTPFGMNFPKEGTASIILGAAHAGDKDKPLRLNAQASDLD